MILIFLFSAFRYTVKDVRNIYGLTFEFAFDNVLNNVDVSGHQFCCLFIAST